MLARSAQVIAARTSIYHDGRVTDEESIAVAETTNAGRSQIATGLIQYNGPSESNGISTKAKPESVITKHLQEKCQQRRKLICTRKEAGT